MNTNTNTSELKTLEDLPKKFVGDGQRPNMFFVSNQRTGEVVALFLGDDKEEQAVGFADDNHGIPLVVEDRLAGTVYENAECVRVRFQEELRKEEEEFDGPRYWVDDCPLRTPFGVDTWSIVDEKAGGVVAYACSQELAQTLIRALQERGK